ncbi:FecR domain-containing protein [Stutzerimonas kirkiae]|uniref:FecR domain-containing protein n=1 Tax=Stutzerimonas kirkiae TaxID=2211392 RepID=UPI00103851D4|nr:FecR domain-containing protein [Stutzerimonas kirkiae]TBV11889.1 iron dicitrate transport regulator FecR [Stutzerimonas kirkiae]
MADLERKTLEAAATWFVQFNAGAVDDAERSAWQEWLQRDPAHARAWARVEKLQRQFGSLPGEVALPTLAGVQARRRAVLKFVALLLTGTAGALSFRELAPYESWLAEQRTGTGQRRRLRLEDGSQLDINTASAVDIHFDSQWRRLRLLQGEILVTTASDVGQRPFIVDTPQGRIRAHGTCFGVRCEGGQTRVGVLQSAVSVQPLRHPGPPLRLEAGQSVDFSDVLIGSPRSLVEGGEAWTRGMLSVVEWRLDDFIRELSRYRPGYLGCDPSVAGLRLSGAFAIDRTDTVLENLALSLPVRVRFLTRYWARVEPASTVG